MFIEAYDSQSRQPLRLSISQIVVYNDEGTPLFVAAEYGTDRSQAISKIGDEDFERTLRALGFGTHKIEVQEISLPPPPAGAVLLSGGNNRFGR